jgi:hypothetical protein
MAWTTPRTFVAAELITASMLNTHIRDNLNFLHDNMKPTSIQRGSINLSTAQTSNTGSITAVNSTANSELFHLGASSAGGTGVFQTASIRLALTNTTTVTATRGTVNDEGATARAADVNFQVTEWPA